MTASLYFSAVVLWGYCSLVCLLLFWLGTYHAFLISKNLTTYEHWKKVYVEEAGVTRNPFDRGLLANWAEVLFPNPAHVLLC